MISPNADGPDEAHDAQPDAQPGAQDPVAEPAADNAPPDSIADAQPDEPGPGRGAQTAPVAVAIGASAGGVEALSRFFANTPADTGCAFVVVMHLSADRESQLAQLLARATGMPVTQATDGAALQANHVYVGPPGHYVEVENSALRLVSVGPRLAKPVTVDRLMRTLAVDQRERAIGVVLTGADGDGAMGIKAIKAEGGLTIAQTPDSAAHPSMPMSAVSTGLVDLQLPIERMPAAIVGYLRDAGLQQASESLPTAKLLPAILQVLRDGTGLDFGGYKTPMLQRRVRRRMGLVRVNEPQAYVARLRQAPDEVALLAGDFLISVTEFFREPDSWDVLAREMVPQILARKARGDAVRVWVPACATGEEAYGMAMLFLEHPLLAERRLQLQVFGTDLDHAALAFARKGRYPDAIEHTVSAQRLQRFFVKLESGWQVRKDLRDALMFAPQNVVSDPPFSHMDVVSCRNLLIYMEHELQRRVLQAFHFALVTEGTLVLGKSETANQQGGLFAAASQQARIYRRLGAQRMTHPRAQNVPSRRAGDPGAAHPAVPREHEYGRVIREELLERRIGALLINGDGRALYLYGPIQPFLDMPQGAPTTDVYAMLRTELRPQLRVALHKAAHDKARVEVLSALQLDSGDRPVRMVVTPVPLLEDGLLLATFEHINVLPLAPAGTSAAADDGSALRVLEEELRNTRRELRATTEEQESTNEELKVANEEAMSMNEELQSTNEELETSKEELQSVNEELNTVNRQLQDKLLELERANDDLGNLLASTQTPTLFLDRNLHIKRFTPDTTRLFRLLPGDVNRPLSDISTQTDMAGLIDDARHVLATLSPREREEPGKGGGFFLRRTLPYRTQDDHIEGVVVTFTDITEIKRSSQVLRRHAAVAQASNDAIVVHDLAGKILAWNQAAQALYGHHEQDVLGTDVARLLPDAARALYRQQVAGVRAGQRLQGIDSQRVRRDGSRLVVSSTISLVPGDDDDSSAIALIERDITPYKMAEDVLRESEQRFRLLADGVPALVWMCDGNGSIEFANREFAQVVGVDSAALVGRRWIDFMHPDDQASAAAAMSSGARGERVEATVKLRTAQDLYRWMKATVLRRGPEAEMGASAMIGSMVDIDAQMRAERELLDAGQRKDEFLAMLGHELRNPLVPIRNAAEVLAHVQGADTRVQWVRQTLVRQVDHVTRLVDDLLDISMITRGTVRLHLEPVDLGYAITRAVEGCGALMQRKKHHFEWHLAPQALWVEADAIRLTQVFENLITNAAKYSDEGSHITLRVTREGKDVVVRVRDDGMGLAPHMLLRVFDLFVQDERSIDRSQGGLGIGLSLVRHLVELHGGSVRADSEGLGKGSEFIVRLPLLKDAPAALPAPPAPGALAAAHGRVMVVDDDAEVAESLVMLLRLMGYEVDYADGLHSALRMARSFLPQLVLMDLAMPNADGYEVAARLRALPEMQGCAGYLSLSGFGQPDDFRRSAQAGFAKHLVKPVDPNELDKAMRALLSA